MSANSATKISGRIVDVLNRREFDGIVTIVDGIIDSIDKAQVVEDQVIIPGFIDSHVHIESSMLLPTEFAEAAIRHGTISTVSDPHEIANVLGLEGVKFMLENASKSPVKFYFGAPSCVPATSFETAGAELDAEHIRYLLSREDIVCLSEMMNIPGVLTNDVSVDEKLQLAKTYGKIIDGHAPGLTGDSLKKYVEAGIVTDHECVTLDEALEKLSLGMKIQIREGSAAKDLDELIPLLFDHYANCMLCSDDKHPDDLWEGHINLMVKRAIQAGVPPMNVLWSASVTPVKLYNLDIGLLQPGDPADLLLVNNLDELTVLSTYIAGVQVSAQDHTGIDADQESPINIFNANIQSPDDLKVYSKSEEIPVISVVDGNLVTEVFTWNPNRNSQDEILIDLDNDILKIAVLNRYNLSRPSIGFIRNFGLKQGAIASSVAHDSHNIVAVGTSDEMLAKGINEIIRAQGGIAAVTADDEMILPLPVAGIMSMQNAYDVGQMYHDLDARAKQLGSSLSAPFMTLSFMALLVIPELKLSDKGLFDGTNFELLKVFD